MKTSSSKTKTIKCMKGCGVLFLFMVFSVTAACIIMPDSTFSMSEKRSLTTFSDVADTGLADSGLSSEFESYASDQMIFRDFFIKLRSAFCLILGKHESQDVYYGSDGYLIAKMEDADYDTLSKTVSAMNEFSGDSGLKSTLVIIPNAVSICADKLPAFALSQDQEEVISYLGQNLSGITLCDLTQSLSSFYADGIQVYYRADHHWTSQAAYLCTDEVFSYLGITRSADYTPSLVCESFIGSLAAKSGYTASALDQIYIYSPDHEQTYTVTDYSASSKSDSIYDYDCLDSSDPYTVFLGGNSSHIKITSSDADKGHLLVFKDSYFNCFLPFLIEEYSEIDVIDPRYYYDDIQMLLLENDFDEILYFYNLNTFASDTALRQVLATDDETGTDSLPQESQSQEPQTTTQTEIILPEETSSPEQTEQTEESQPEETKSGSLPQESTSTEPEETTQSSLDELQASLKAQVDSLSITTLSDEERAAYRNRLSSCVIVGDSMAQAALEYGFLDSSHVFYRRGYSIGQLKDAIDEAAAMQPDTVIFFTGLNDTDYYTEIADYAAAYLEKVNYTKSLLPDADIYVCSMLPPSDALGAVRPDLARAPAYNTALSDMCSTYGINYIDTTWMVNQSLYMSDGIHFISSFYDIYIQYITTAAGL